MVEDLQREPKGCERQVTLQEQGEEVGPLQALREDGLRSHRS